AGRQVLLVVEGGDDVAHDGQGVGVVEGVVVDDAGGPGVDVGAAQLLLRNVDADGRLHQRGAAEVDRALLADDHRLVGHGRHVGAAGGAHAHDAGDLGNAEPRQRGLVVEDAAEV